MAGLSGFLLAAAAGRLKHALLLDTALNSYGSFSFSFINFSHGGGFAAELQIALSIDNPHYPCFPTLVCATFKANMCILFWYLLSIRFKNKKILHIYMLTICPFNSNYKLYDYNLGFPKIWVIYY